MTRLVVLMPLYDDWAALPPLLGRMESVGRCWARWSLVAILLQTVSLSLVFIFMILNSRNYSTVIPRRDYGDYIASEERIRP